MESEQNLRRCQEEGDPSWEIILGRRKDDQGCVMARGRELRSGQREADIGRVEEEGRQ